MCYSGVIKQNLNIQVPKKEFPLVPSVGLGCTFLYRTESRYMYVGVQKKRAKRCHFVIVRKFSIVSSTL